MEVLCTFLHESSSCIVDWITLRLDQTGPGPLRPLCKSGPPSILSDEGGKRKRIISFNGVQVKGSKWVEGGSPSCVLRWFL